MRSNQNIAALSWMLLLAAYRIGLQGEASAEAGMPTPMMPDR